MSGWIGVDLDGTLAHYDGFAGPEHIGEPVVEMVERVQRWLEAGLDVRIFTARVCYGDSQGCRPAIEAWCLKHIGRVLPITCEKDYGMIELWDDRCVAVEPNTGKPLNLSRRELD